MRSPKPFVKQAVLHQLAPDVSGSVDAVEAVHIRTVVVDRNLHRPNPLGDLRPLVVAVGRHRQLRIDLRACNTCASYDDKYQQLFHGRPLLIHDSFLLSRVEFDGQVGALAPFVPCAVVHARVEPKKARGEPDGGGALADVAVAHDLRAGFYSGAAKQLLERRTIAEGDFLDRQIGGTGNVPADAIEVASHPRIDDCYRRLMKVSDNPRRIGEYIPVYFRREVPRSRRPAFR